MFRSSITENINGDDGKVLCDFNIKVDVSEPSNAPKDKVQSEKKTEVGTDSNLEEDEKSKSGLTSLDDLKNSLSTKCKLSPINMNVDILEMFAKQQKMESNPIKFINNKEFMKLIDPKYPVLIVDVRYPYEYQGGRIKSAINLWEPIDLVSLLFIDQVNEIFNSDLQEVLRQLFKKIERKISSIDSSRSIIFYCEFSNERAPKMAYFFRNIDRYLNKNTTLSYPNMYILEKGYSNFFEMNPELCTSKKYVKMIESDKSHCAESNQIFPSCGVGRVINKLMTSMHRKFYGVYRETCRLEIKAFDEYINN